MYVVIKDNMVDNIIVIDPQQIDEYSAALGLLVVETPLAVMIGDSYDGTDFYRDGEPVTMQIPPYPAPSPDISEMEEALNILGVDTGNKE